MRILGLSAFYHDSAAALVEDGRIVAAAQEERFTRKRHDPGFPVHAVRYCLAAGRCTLGDVDLIAFYEKPRLKLDRLLKTYLSFAPRGFASFRRAADAWMGGKLDHRRLIAGGLGDLLDGVDLHERLVFAEHHQSHAASAFYPSPFEEAAILTMDGVGEWATTSLAAGSGNDLRMLEEIEFPHSLGLLYAAFTYYTGFKVNSGEYKVMGLAPYGEPRYASLIRDNLVDVKDDGSFRLNLDYFGYGTGLRMTNERFDELFGGPPRRPESELGQRHMDLAASIQAVTEEIVVKLARGVRDRTGARALCLAGGVALNCVANARVLREGIFDDIWIQPAAGDAGGALGAALVAYHRFRSAPRGADGRTDRMEGAYLGPEFSQDAIEGRLRAAGAHFERLDPEALIARTVEALTRDMAVGWFQGRMEFGPRALGNRSIIADARSPAMQKTLNLRVKFRESFRPFAPSVLEADAGDWFEIDRPSPYMLLVADVAGRWRKSAVSGDDDALGIARLNVPRSAIPAVTHVDCSSRLHTVDARTNPRFSALLTAFRSATGCPVLVNTSFNIRGEPIVCTPEEAFRCFMGTDIERLAIGDCFLAKEQQDPSLRVDYKDSLEPD